MARKKTKREKKLEEVSRILENYNKFSSPKKSVYSPKSITYKDFLKEVKGRKKNILESLCNFTEKIFPFTISKTSKEKLKNNLDISYLSITPEGIMSLAFWTFVMISLISISIFVVTMDLFFTFFCYIIGLILTYYIYKYPSLRAKSSMVSMSSDTVLAILYMIIYMRRSPNLEGAIRFASENLSGPLSWDLKKIFWDIEVGTYSSASEALNYYIIRWKEINPDFSEALTLLKSKGISPSKSKKIFDQALDLILRGTKKRAKNYITSLRMPVMLIHAMGVLLPVMGLVLFPIVVIFLTEAVKPGFLFIGYNIILPIILLLLINYTLRNRPSTFSQPDISLVRGVAPMNYFKIGKREIPIWPITLIILIFIFGYVIFSSGQCFFPNEELKDYCTKNMFSTLLTSFLIIIGLGVGIISYCFLDSIGKVKVRNDIEKMEGEFPVALFQIGNSLSSGEPIESVVSKSTKALKGMKISKLFEDSAKNMSQFGYTFEQSIFDKRMGSIWNFPSYLIRSLMSAIVQSAKKGTKVASDTMMIISKYLRGISEVKEDVGRILGETIASMKFLGFFLAPMISGVTVTMAIVIIEILAAISSTMPLTSSGSFDFSGLPDQSMGGGMSLGFLQGGIDNISPVLFQIIVGIYMLEVVIILTYFGNRLEFGDDKIGLRKRLATSVTISIIIYLLSWVITYTVFYEPISAILQPAL